MFSGVPVLARTDFPDYKPAAAASSAAAAASHITHTDWLFLFLNHFIISPLQCSHNRKCEQDVTFPHPATQMAPAHSHFTPREKESCPPPAPSAGPHSAHLCIPGFSVTLTENRAAFFFFYS